MAADTKKIMIFWFPSYCWEILAQTLLWFIRLLTWDILVAPVSLLGWNLASQTPNPLELAAPRKSIGVATANNGVFRKGKKIQDTFFQ